MAIPFFHIWISQQKSPKKVYPILWVSHTLPQPLKQVQEKDEPNLS